MSFVIKANGVVLPSPTEISTGDEILWSSNTGRSTDSGKMIGDVIASKQTISIKWEYVTRAEKQLIAHNMPPGFFALSLVYGEEETTITCYRGPFATEDLGFIGDGNYYYRTVSCELVEQ